jgi:hypothetical protein
MGEEIKVHKALMAKPEGKRPLGRPMPRYDDGIRMDLKDVGWVECRVDLVGSYADRWQALVNTVMNLRVLAYYVKYTWE